MLKTLFLFLLLLIGATSLSQSIIYQDFFYGGVTGGGFSTGMTGYGTGTIDIFIEPGSEIRKGFLLIQRSQNPLPCMISIDGQSIQVSSESAHTNFEIVNSGQNALSGVHCIDVSNFINPNNNSYVISIPQQNNSVIEEFYSSVYLIVLYENSTLPIVNSIIALNNLDLTNDMYYSLSQVNYIDNSLPVGFAIYSDRIGSIQPGITDGSDVFIETQNIGLIGGDDNVNSSFIGGGVKGHFYFQNNNLYGLDDDNANSTMYESDGLADISQYLLNLTSVNFNLKWQDYNNINRYNLYLSFFLAYSTTCDTFSVFTSNDTTICSGQTLQLSATGGQSYEWLPATDLSCTNCPNPIFTGDTSRFYTVRIWNNDSCSVVRPLKVNVRPKPLFGNINSIASQCGTNNGSVSIGVASGTQAPVTYSLNDTLVQSNGTFINLASGTYSFNFIDGFGCVSKDTVITVGEINTTLANFTVSPSYGVVPLEVSFTNTSVNATDYAWSINALDQGNNLSSYTCDTSGMYTIQLIAWQYDPSCADTVVMTILAVDKLIIPTAFTPDNDGINDRWVIPNIKNIYPNHLVSLYNRWGTLLYEAPEGKYNVYPWKGIYKDEDLPVGSYYFIIDPNDGVTEVLKGIVSIVK